MDQHIAAASTSREEPSLSLTMSSMGSLIKDERCVDDPEEDNEEIAHLRAYAQGVRDFMGMFRMHAADLFDEELVAPQRSDRPMDEFEDAEDEFDEASSHRGQLRRVGGERKVRSSWEEGDSYDDGFEFEYSDLGDGGDLDFEEESVSGAQWPC